MNNLVEVKAMAVRRVKDESGNETPGFELQLFEESMLEGYMGKGYFFKFDGKMADVLVDLLKRSGVIEENLAENS